MVRVARAKANITFRCLPHGRRTFMRSRQGLGKRLGGNHSTWLHFLLLYLAGGSRTILPLPNLNDAPTRLKCLHSVSGAPKPPGTRYLTQIAPRSGEQITSSGPF